MRHEPWKHCTWRCRVSRGQSIKRCQTSPLSLHIPLHSQASPRLRSPFFLQQNKPKKNSIHHPVPLPTHQPPKCTSPSYSPSPASQPSPPPPLSSKPRTTTSAADYRNATVPIRTNAFPWEPFCQPCQSFQGSGKAACLGKGSATSATKRTRAARSAARQATPLRDTSDPALPGKRPLFPSARGELGSGH